VEVAAKQQYRSKLALLGSVEWIEREVGEETGAHWSNCTPDYTNKLCRRISELSHTLTQALQSNLHTHHYSGSTISINLHVLTQDGSLLAALINASTLALIDAGVPMTDYLCACTAGSTSNTSSSNAAPRPQAALPGLSNLGDDVDDPLLDLNGMEEQELPFLTVGTLGASEKVVVCILETRVHTGKLEEMLAVGVDGCKRVRGILDSVIKSHGKRMVAEG
jgi:exosome complex component RRP41